MHRIAILVEYPTVNGGENSMLAVLKHLLNNQDNEFEVCVLGLPEGQMAERVTALGIPIIELNLFDKSGVRLPRERTIPQLLEAAELSGSELIHGNSLSMGRLLGAARRVHEQLLATSHVRDIMKLSRAAISDLNANQKVIAVSQATLQFHIGQGLDQSVGSVIHNGINVDTFAVDLSSRQQIRKQLCISDDAPVLLTVGQIGLRKGLDTLAAAAQQLAEIHPEIHWLLAGERFSQKGESIDFEAKVIREFSTCEPALKLHRLGYREDIPDLMRASDILVHGARQEPLGRVLLEAAASELAVVATSVGGTPEIIIDGESGLLVPPDSPSEMATSISRLITESALRKQLAVAAHNRVRNNFGIAQSAERLASIWKSVISTSKSSRRPGA